MVWRKLPNVVLKQKQSIGTYKQLLQNQIRLFSTTNNTNNSGDNNNNGENGSNEEDSNLLNMALSMQKMKNNKNINNGNKESSTTSETSTQTSPTEGLENQEQVENLEEQDEEYEEESEFEIESYLNNRLNENGDLLTDDGELTVLTFDEATEADRITMAEISNEENYIGAPISKNEKAVKIEFIKAFTHYNPRAGEGSFTGPDSNEQYEQLLEKISQQEDYTPEGEEKGEELSYPITHPLTDATRNDILIKFIKNYKSHGQELYRQYITAKQLSNFGLLMQDFDAEYPPYVDRINGNIMVYDGKVSTYKYYGNVYSKDTERYSTEQVLRSRFFNDDIVIVSKYLKSSPPSIRDAIVGDAKLFEQVIRLIYIDQKTTAAAQGVPQVQLSKHAEAIARVAKDTGLISEEMANEIYSAKQEKEYQFMDNPSNFYKDQVERIENAPLPEETEFDKDAQDMKNDQIAKKIDVNFVPELSVEGIRGEHLKDQLSQYYLDLSRREIPKPVAKEVENTKDKYKPIPAGYEIYDTPVEDVLPSKPTQFDSFNPDFYRDFIQYRVLAMPHENLRMEEVIDAFKEEKGFQGFIESDNRIKRDEVKFFMENYLDHDFEVDFDKIQKDLESLYYKPVSITTSSSKPTNNKSTNNKTNNNSTNNNSANNNSTNKVNEDVLNSSIVSSVLNIQNQLSNNNNNNNNNNNISTSSDKIGNIELNDQEDSPLSDEFTVPTDLDNPSEQDDTNIDAELFLDSDETLTLSPEEMREGYEGDEYVDFERDHEIYDQHRNSKEVTEEEVTEEEFTEEQLTEDVGEEQVTEEPVGKEKENDKSVENERSGEESGEELTEETESTEASRQTFREEGQGISPSKHDFDDPFFDKELANANIRDDEHEELPQYLTEGDELFVKDMEDYTDSLFLTINEEDNTVTFGELDEDDILLSGENEVGLSEEDSKLVPFEVDFGKINNEIEANRSKLSKEELLQSIQEEFGMNYYDGIVHDKVLAEIKQKLTPESFTYLMEILESTENEVDTNDEPLSEETQLKIKQITDEIRQLNGEFDENVVVNQENKSSVNYDDIDEDDYITETEEVDDEEGYDGVGFRFNEEDSDVNLVHPEGIQQFEDAIEEMELFDLMEGTYEEDLDLLRAEADMYVRRNEKKMKVLAKRRAFAKEMRDKQLEQNKINPPVKAPYVIPTLPTGKNIYTSVLAPPNSYLKLQTIRHQPQNKKAHKEIIEESYRALSSNAFYDAKEAEFAVKKIHKELSNAEGYKRYRQHSKVTSKPVPSPILSKPDLLVETEKLHDFNPLYRNN